MKLQSTLLALALALTACAKRPDAIVPADIPMAAYTNLSCAQLAQEYSKEQVSLTAVSKQQHDAANGDAFGVFLIGVPMSSTFGGDKEGQVAVAKGKVQAIQSSMMSKGCNVPPAPAAKKASRVIEVSRLRSPQLLSAASIRKCPATTDYQSIAKTVSPNVRNDSGIAVKIAVVAKPVNGAA